MMCNNIYRFNAVLQKVDDMDATYIVFPQDLKKEFNCGRLKVNANINGIAYAGSIVNMGIKNIDGSICYIMGINKNIRKKINKKIGDIINIEITLRD